MKRSDDVKGLKVLPRRWVVERTFGWLGRQRWLSKDYEHLTEPSQMMIEHALKQMWDPLKLLNPGKIFAH